MDRSTKAARHRERYRPGDRSVQEKVAHMGVDRYRYRCVPVLCPCGTGW
jgi:hypothetical protein